MENKAPNVRVNSNEQPAKLPPRIPKLGDTMNLDGVIYKVIAGDRIKKRFVIQAVTKK